MGYYADLPYCSEVVPVKFSGLLSSAAQNIGVEFDGVYELTREQVQKTCSEMARMFASGQAFKEADPYQIYPLELSDWHARSFVRDAENLVTLLEWLSDPKNEQLIFS
jgi:hypothetical protein